MNKQINLGVILYGNAGQTKANQRQLADLSGALKSFRVKAYDFNHSGQNKLLADFKLRKIDVILKNAYGRGNEAVIENFLELYGIPYFGSGQLSVILGTNKFLSKTLFRRHDLPVAKDVYIDGLLWKSSRTTILNSIAELGYPCIIKDVGGTDSRGIYIAKNQKHCADLLNKYVGNFSAIIAEKFIDKTYEVTCLAVGNKQPKIYEPVGVLGNLLSKRVKDGKTAIGKEFPARLNPALIKKIKSITKTAHQALGCRTFSQSNILVRGRQLFLIEVDVHPGFSAASVATASAGFERQSLNDLFLNFYKSLNQK